MSDLYLNHGIKSNAAFFQGPRSISIEIDTNVDPPVLVVEVAGVTKRASNALDKEDYSFIAVAKTNGLVEIWLGLKGSLVKDSSFDLSGAQYTIADSEAIFLVQPGASKAQLPHGWVGKMNFNTAQQWGDTAHSPKEYPLWDTYIEKNMWAVSRKFLKSALDFGLLFFEFIF